MLFRSMGRFPSAAHLCSWAGVCPGNYQSAGRRKHGKTTKGNKALKTNLTQCAKSAKTVKSSYFFAQYQRISARRGKNRATLAVAHSMLIAIYHILKNKTAFHDLGSDYYDSFNRDRKINSYLKRLKILFSFLGFCSFVCLKCALNRLELFLLLDMLIIELARILGLYF